MEGSTHYPYPHSRQALLQGLPVSQEGTDWDTWPRDLIAFAQDPQVSEEISHIENFGPPVRGFLDMPGHSDLMYWLKPTLLMSEGFRAVPDKIPSHTSSLLESGSRKTPKQSRRTRRKRVKAPSRSSGQLTGTREALERPYLCNTCGERYAQRQGVNRHFRAKHNPSSCVYCGVKWSRPYQYRNHIEKQHPNIDPDLILGKASGSRRKATVVGRE